LISTPPLRLDLFILILLTPVTLFILINLIVDLRVMIYKSSAFKPCH
jgi:hypothetical protein